MEVKQVQFVQANHAERLLRLERRQADDAAIKSVWNSPFPSVLGGTPQHGKHPSSHSCPIPSNKSSEGPVQLPPNEDFEDFDEQGQNLLGSLHLEADDEPIRRGAASRANSVRFDESALQGSNWGQSTRHSGEFPVRPGSGLGGHAMMERSLSHKSDGRHSSAGHSVHSTHSVASGRASSLGLENNFLLGGHEDDSPLDMPGPQPGFLFLGSVQSIVRCWLTQQYAHDTLLYAVVCSGSQKSTLDYSLVKELDLLDEVHRDLDGIFRISIPIFFAEATVMNSHSRSSSPSRQVPYITGDFEVVGLDQSDYSDGKKNIHIFIGSDILRANNADLLLSQNLMTLYGNGQDRDKLSIPFVRPEDDSLFKHITTTNTAPERPKLNASAPEFVSGEPKSPGAILEERSKAAASRAEAQNVDLDDALSPTTLQPGVSGKQSTPSVRSDAGGESDRAPTGRASSEAGGRENSAATDEKRSTTGIWGSWRQGTPGNGSENGAREIGLSGYQPAGRGRNMKVLKPQKSSNSNSARTGASNEPPGLPRSSGELRRKSQASIASSDQAGSSTSSSVRWDTSKRAATSSVGTGSSGTTSGAESKAQVQAKSNLGPAPRTANPVGGASAFSWMNPGGKPKTPAQAAAE